MWKTKTNKNTSNKYFIVSFLFGNSSGHVGWISNVYPNYECIAEYLSKEIETKGKVVIVNIMSVSKEEYDSFFDKKENCNREYNKARE